MNQSKVCFLIVTYGEVFYETKTFKSLIASLRLSKFPNAKIYIFDNTDKAGWSIDKTAIEAYPQVSYYADNTNPGLCVAYNHTVNIAASASMDWIVLLDQDTDFPIHSAQEYFDASSRTPNIYLKVPVLYVNNRIFSPIILFFKRPIYLKQISPGPQDLMKISFANSGMMVNIPFFIKTGGYNEKIKLDFADYQFLNKARKFTKTFEVLPIVCEHDFSNNEKDIEKALRRYKIYVKDLANCEKKGLIDYLGYILVDTLHLAKLTYKFRTIRFFNAFIRERLNFNK